MSSRVPALALNNESHIFVGSLSGIFRSLDYGKTWKLVGFPATKVRYLTEHEDGTIFACAEDFPVFGDIFQLEDDEMSWRSLFRGEHRIYSLAIHPNGDFFAGTSIFDHAGYGGVFRSSDRGKSWFTTGLRYNDTYSLAVNTNGDLFAGTQQGVLRLSAPVENWVKMGLANFEVREIKINSKDHIFARTADGGIYVSIDDGRTWSPTNLSIYDAACFTIDKQDRIYIGTAAEGIFRSTDNGTNWSHIGLDSVNINTIVVPSNGVIFAGTNDGVHVSTDDGGSWIPHNGGLSDTNVFSLVKSQNGYIYAGTSGSGVFRSSMPISSIEAVEVDVPLFFVLKQNYPNPFNPITTIEFDVSHPSYLTLTIYNINGEQLETLMAKKLSAGKYKVQWQPSGLASGVYFYRLQTSDPSTGSGQKFEQTKKLLLLK